MEDRMQINQHMDSVKENTDKIKLHTHTHRIKDLER